MHLIPREMVFHILMVGKGSRTLNRATTPSFPYSFTKGEMKSTFSYTSFYKVHTSSTLCFAEPTLEKLKQAKLLYCPTSRILCDPILAKLNHIKLSSETEFGITMHTPLCEPAVHTLTSHSVLRSPSETNRVCD